ncbi:type I restriction endonuclease EcoAI subunit S [Shewanella sp. c952]|uniref:restriction endonuclease subunit S n=1 Tax=Shewanella sp. c952 TaxID=2815913 RepID=UPI001BB88D4A|nr:restriction endonuclease subunit S [Shewanella sp. c952]GIU15879.1 type I restriction endonuclease EcoAI subunit S [Shewanella sp. c952]
MADSLPTKSKTASKVDSTNLNIITDHIDIWTSAIKQKSPSGRGSSKKFSLHGIKKLRELILELAVRGKLVPQDEKDEPASVLLERIAAEKAQLVKDKKIKKPKALPEISKDEKPFELPVNWSFLRLENMCELITKGSSPKWQGVSYTDNPDDVLFVTSENVGAFKILLDKKKYVERTFNEIEPRSILRKNDFLMNIVGASIGRCAIFDLNEVANINQAVCLIRSFSKHIVPDFFLKFFNSHTCISYMYDKQVENARPNLSMSNIAKFIIPIPPIEEQHRIVAKVDELMSLCDALEAQTEASISAHQTIVETLLNALLLPNTAQPTGAQTASGSKTANSLSSAAGSEHAQSPDPSFENSHEPHFIDSPELLFKENWQRVAEHFDTLFTTSASIDTLKQTILQLAVMGKLVEQASCEARNSANYEPAAKLLERIAAEKAQLIADKKIKKQKPLPAITDQEKPFELPHGWEWVRFGDLVNFKAELVRPEAFLDFDQVGPDSIEKGTGQLIKRRTVKESGIKGPNSRFYNGQILYSKIRPSLSKAIIAEFDGLCSADMYPLESMIYSKYLLKSILSEVFLEQVRLAENRIKMPKLNIDSLSEIKLPLAPLEEQHRIVTKVDELMALCDQLKARLSDAQTTQLHLTDAIVEQAV